MLKDFINLGRENKAIDTRLNNQSKVFDGSYSSAAPISEPPSRKNYQTYPYDYFCGTNAKVFFGDIWVDDIVTIQYSVKQDKEPIYGYASQTYDAIARGIVVVQGSFTIAFKEMGYLNVVMNALEGQRNRASSDKIATVLTQTLSSAASGTLAYDPSFERIGSSNGMTYSPTGQPEIIRQQQTIEDILMYKKYGNVVSSGLSKDIGLDSRDRDFEDFAELMEDTVWGDSNGRPYTAENINLRRADEFDYNWDGNRDLGGIVTGKTLFGTDYSKTLNIMITFGDINDYRAEHTLIALNDVHIVNMSMVVSPTGEPIGETYFFIARDINKALSSQTIKSLSPVKYNVGLGDDYDFKSITEQDIGKIEDFIASNDLVGITVSAQSLSKYNGTWSSDNSYNDILGLLTQLNNWESKMDQVLKLVERQINDPAGEFNKVTTRNNYTQWLMKVNVMKRDGAKETFNIILDQQIPNTLTYRIISPTRDNFGSVSLFTRATLWETIKTAEVTKDEPEINQKAMSRELPVDASGYAPSQQDVPMPTEAQTIEATTEAFKQAEYNVTVPDNKKAIEEQAKKDAAKYNQLSINAPGGVAYQTQSPQGEYSHQYSKTAAIDVAPVAAGPMTGQVFAPFSPNATITFGESAVKVEDPSGQSYTLSHQQIEKQYVGQSVKASSIPGIQETGGAYFTPLKSDPSSAKFSGPHGHFQQNNVPPRAYQINEEQASEDFRKWLQDRYLAENIEYRVIKKSDQKF